MDKYMYVGPVMIFGKVVQEQWKGVTTAVSESKARSNLAYQWKKKNNLVPNSAPVTFPEPLQII